MSDFLIICEFNPLHMAHAWLLQRARELGAQSVTCVMSGNATQRGELAVLDKYSRAEAAIRCGADCVLELPYPWCAASADFFAAGALDVGGHLCDTLLFGSECGDVDYLLAAAEVCESESFKVAYEQKRKSGVGAAVAYLDCLAESGFENLGSNDLLGVAYIRVIKRKGLNIKPITVKRDGAAYNEGDIIDAPYQSATAIRALVGEGKLKEASKYLPAPMQEILKSAEQNGELTDTRLIDSAVLCYFRLCNADKLEGIADTEGGLANRLVSCARETATAEQMFAALRTKRYTDAKLRRAVLFSMTGVRATDLFESPEYTLLLGASRTGRELLCKHRKNEKIKIITKPADAPEGSVQYECSRRLDEIFSLARKKKTTAGEFLKKKAYIEK